MYGSKTVTKRQILVLEKLDQLNIKQNVRKTPTWLSVNGKLNKNNLIDDLHVLTNYALVNHVSEEKKNQQNWNYYALSDLGEIITIKEKIKKIADIKNKESSFEDEKIILDNLKNNLELVRKYWDILEKEFSDFSYWCLRQTILSFDFFVRLEYYLNFIIISIQITLPSKNGCGFTHIEKFHQCFLENKKNDSELSLQDMGLVSPSQFKIDYDKKGREYINKNLKENLMKDIQNFLTYAFYSFLVQNIHMEKIAVKKFQEESKNYKPNNFEDFKKQKTQTIHHGNKFLTWMGEKSTYSDFDAIIDRLNSYESKANGILKDKNLNFHLKRIQKIIEEINFNPLLKNN